jgi:hypothetical protein
MVNRILSLQLVFTLAATPAWALSGGPYDQYLSYQSLTGTYGVSISGLGVRQSTQGVMLLAVPTRGMAFAKVLVFDLGLMYAGQATGVMKVDGAVGKVKMLSEMTHFVVKATSNGADAGTRAVFPDLQLSGVMNLELQPDYFTGITAVGGSANLWQKTIRLQSYTTATDTTTIDSGSGSAVVTSTETTTRPGKDQDQEGTDSLRDQGSNFDLSRPELQLTFDGMRQSTTAAALTRFGAPSQESLFAVESGEFGGSPTGNGANANGN